MNTISFRFKKSAKRFIQRLLPTFASSLIISVYRFFFSYIPLVVRRAVTRIRFSERQVVTIKNTDIRIVIDPANGRTDAGLFFTRERDPDVIAVMKASCTPGSNVLDIGANIGYNTLWASSLVGAHGHVYSFEPVPRLVAQIKESIRENHMSNITLIEKAAGDKHGEAVIYMHKEDAGLSSLSNEKDAGAMLSIPVTTVDTELRDVGNVSLIKMDVEGYELEALMGAQGLIARNKPVIVFEFSPHLYEKDKAGKSLEVLNYFVEQGYSIYPIEDLDTAVRPAEFSSLIERTLLDEAVPNFVASLRSLGSRPGMRETP